MVKDSKEKKDFNLNLEEMEKAGLHFGHRTSRIHPKIKPYLASIKNNVNLFNLEKTVEKLKEALGFIKELVAEDKVLLLVGTKIQVKNLVKETAIELGLPYVSERWLGGTFTNFDNLKKRIDYFKDLEKKKASGELEKYTKKERALFDQELRRLETKFGGIKELTKLPDAIFVLDMKKDELAVKEAKAKNIKVIGIADTNVDPTLADYVITANDDALPGIKYILDRAKEVILKAKK